VCLGEVRRGVCDHHGLWSSHQLLTALDKRHAVRHTWHPFTPVMHACPRCLGEVAEARAGYECVDHGHGRYPHGPFQLDELLGPSAQREGAAERERLARARERSLERKAEPTITWPTFQRPNIPHLARIIAGVAVVATTLLYLVR
jgi:hypothetical protein